MPLLPSRSISFRPSLMLINDLSKIENQPDRGERFYHETIPSKVYKQVFSKLTVPELKRSRIVCKKWHLEIFPLLEEMTSFTFRGTNNPSDLTEARKLADFLKVVQRDGFQWKILRIMYPNPTDALPSPVLIQWSHLRNVGANFFELKQWLSRSHTINVSFLELSNVQINWSKYLLILRELENLERFHDTCDPHRDAVLSLDFEKDLVCTDKLEESTEFQSLQMSYEDQRFLSTVLKHVVIKRPKLEEIIIFLKLFLLMECKSLESLELNAQNCFGSSNNALNFVANKRKSMRLADVKTILFSKLGLLLQNNENTLSQLKLSFVHSSITECFDQYSKDYSNMNANMYKPDLRDFIAYVNYHRWSNYRLSSLSSLTLEFESRKIASVEEIEGFSKFLNSLKSLKTLHISHFLITSYNSLSLPLIMKRLSKPQTDSKQVICSCTFGVALRNQEDAQVQLPTNLDLYYHNLSSIIITCTAKDSDIYPTLFSASVLSPPVDASTSTSETNPESSNIEINYYSQGVFPYEKSVKNFWLVDERPLGRTHKLFSLRQIVYTYPNLTSFIVKDSKHSLQCSAEDMSRWSIIDDYGMQLILKSLIGLKHLDLSGNLIYLTDCGMTGLSFKACERMLELRDFQQRKADQKGYSFSNLKNLEYCSLQYLGTKFTDITLFLAFNELIKLKTLKLFGLIEISYDALEYVNKKFPSTKECEVVIFSSPS